MRKNARITRLEQEVQQLSAVVSELLAIVTQPTALPTPSAPRQVVPKDWRSKPRKKINTQNARKDWNRDDVRFLAEMLNKGVSRKEIARLMGRTERAVGGAIARHLKVDNA